MITTVDTPPLSHSHFNSLESLFADTVIDSYLYKKYCDFVEKTQDQQDKQLVSQYKQDSDDTTINFSSYKKLHGL